MPFEEDGGRKSESAVYDTPPTFDPYDPPEDPESVQPTPISPAPSSNPGNVGGTSGEDGEPEPQAPPQDSGEEQGPLPEFDPKHREEFEGLLYLGRLTETFRMFGHTFVVKTLTTEELAEIGLIVRPYAGTNAENAVYQSAVVAAAVVTVDGQPLPQAITVDDSDELATVKFPYVKKNWMPPVREAIYNRCFRLELTTRRVLSAMGEASG